MFTKKNKVTKNNIVEVSDFLQKKSIPSIIVSDLNIQGDLISEGAIEIGGEVNGNIKCNFVTIRKSANIKGNIQADNLVINGKVEGLIQAKHLSVTASAEIKGTLEYGFLNTESGAQISGKLVKKQYEDLDKIKEIEKLDEEEFIAKIDDIFNSNKEALPVLEQNNKEKSEDSSVEKKKNKTAKKSTNRKNKTKTKAKS